MKQIHRPATLARPALDARPDPDWVRGRCPECGEVLVSNAHYINGKGYIIVWECWRGLQSGECAYKRVL